MIKGIIIVNNHGKPRLVKFYHAVESEQQQQSVIRRVFTQVSSRPDSFCNYLEGIVPEWGEHIKLIYRHYATLYFVFAVDAQESDLGILDLIQVFVEALDKCFENVCELDLIFHSDRVHYVLDEIVMGGMVLETNISSILQAIKEYVGIEVGRRLSVFDFLANWFLHVSSWMGNVCCLTVNFVVFILQFYFLLLPNDYLNPTIQSGKIGNRIIEQSGWWSISNENKRTIGAV